MDGWAEDISPGERTTPTYDGASPLFGGEVFFDGWQVVVNFFDILGD